MLDRSANTQTGKDRMPTHFMRQITALSLGLSLLLIIMAATAVAGETRTFDLRLVDGHVAGEPGSIRVTQNDQVLIRWQADRETEVHLHGYDVKSVLSADGVTEMRIKAHATGRYPITAHGHHGDGHDEPVLIHLEVYPE